ncbi:MAG TPA: phosphoribosylamine--glycine ligase [Gemmatimonadaceae bacterium]|nr:phosphoribosylamine--glycine ligase [Gemmatimonadaceae bacterium]
MKVLIVGGGGREHALAWKLKRDDPTAELLAAPGNPGLATLGRCVSVAANDLQGLLRLAEAEAVDLTVVGPEAPLAEGIVDLFRSRQQAIFGPTKAAAQIEASKAFAKALMVDAGIPTARAIPSSDAASAKRAAREFGAPVVIKASGLAAGKGVIVCGSTAEADSAIDYMLREHAFGAAGDEILVEEFMQGEELSVFALTDGTAVLPMLPAQDHKRRDDGDEGPNTGGMGAYAPVSIATDGVITQVLTDILEPTVAALSDRGTPFTGLLYAGLMLTGDGPKVVEFNCRFGDPETEAILPLLESNLLDVLDSVAHGEGIGLGPLVWSEKSAVTTVVAAAGYPDTPRKGDVISLPPDGDDLIVFHAGTARSATGDLISAGGRVLAITGVGIDTGAARDASLRGAADVHLAGKHFRSDIGWRELARNAGASRN